MGTGSEREGAGQGTGVSLRGSVVDALFPRGLPAIHDLPRSGERGKARVEAATHPGAGRVRGIFLTPTPGLLPRART